MNVSKRKLVAWIAFVLYERERYPENTERWSAMSHLFFISSYRQVVKPSVFQTEVTSSILVGTTTPPAQSSYSRGFYFLKYPFFSFSLRSLSKTFSASSNDTGRSVLVPIVNVFHTRPYWKLTTNLFPDFSICKLY